MVGSRSSSGSSAGSGSSVGQRAWSVGNGRARVGSRRRAAALIVYADTSAGEAGDRRIGIGSLGRALASSGPHRVESTGVSRGAVGGHRSPSRGTHCAPSGERSTGPLAQGFGVVWSASPSRAATAANRLSRVQRPAPVVNRVAARRCASTDPTPRPNNSWCSTRGPTPRRRLRPWRAGGCGGGR